MSKIEENEQPLINFIIYYDKIPMFIFSNLNFEDIKIGYYVKNNNEHLGLVLDINYSPTDIFTDIDFQIKKKFSNSDINIEYYHEFFSESNSTWNTEKINKNTNIYSIIQPDETINNSVIITEL